MTALIVLFVALDRGGSPECARWRRPPSHWRGLIFRRVVPGRGKTKACLNPELSVSFRLIETLHRVRAERRRRQERMNARAEPLKHSADNLRGRFGNGGIFYLNRP